MTDEFRETENMYESSLYQKREDMGRTLQRPINYNTDNLYPLKYSERYIRPSYTEMNDHLDETGPNNS